MEPPFFRLISSNRFSISPYFSLFTLPVFRTSYAQKPEFKTKMPQIGIKSIEKEYRIKKGCINSPTEILIQSSSS